MRTADFSSAPPVGQATAMFVGGTCFSGPLAVVQLLRRWSPLVRRMKHSPGYRGHYVWYRFPFTFGTTAFFADLEALLLFARSREHAAIMRWVMEPGNARGGFIRLYEAHAQGYSSGIWRAEGNVMRAIDRFTKLAGEPEAPTVVSRANR